MHKVNGEILYSFIPTLNPILAANHVNKKAHYKYPIISRTIKKVNII